MFDSLEARRLLSTLQITGTAGNDAVELQELTAAADGATYDINNVGSTDITATIDDASVVVAANSSMTTTQIKVDSVITGISADLQDGDDRLTPQTSFSIPVVFLGGTGTDTLTGGTQDDRLDGGTGDSQIDGREGNDTLVGDNAVGGDGNDSITGSNADGGEGNDTIIGGYANGEGGNDSITGDDVYGGDGNDTIAGNYSDGGGGDDRLEGTGGDDQLTGGDGDDTLLAGDGNDTLFGGAGGDSLVGGDGDDSYILYDAPVGTEKDSFTETANGGHDTFYFDGSGNPDAIGAIGVIGDVPVNVDLTKSGQTVLQGGRTVSAISGSQANIEDVVGGLGNDTIIGNARDNNLIGSQDLSNFSVESTLNPLTDADRIYGGLGNDTLVGNGPDTVSGGDGNDTLITREQTNVKLVTDGGAGRDRQIADFEFLSDPLPVYYLTGNIEDAEIQSSTLLGHFVGNGRDNFITVDLVQFLSRDQGFYEHRGVAIVSGGAGNDTIVGQVPGTSGFGTGMIGNTPQIFEGNAGNDLLVGATDDTAYNDDLYLRGDAGSDTLQSAGGTVWADYSDMSTPVSINLASRKYVAPNGDVDTFGVGVENVRGSSVNDTLVGDSKNNVLDGFFGRDDLSGGAGFDSVRYSLRKRGIVASLDGKANDGEAGEKDFIRSDIEGLIGTVYNDTLLGGAGNDRLSGLEGDDTLNGGAGNDTLIGNAGNDTLNGGAGNDTAQYIDYSRIDSNFDSTTDAQDPSFPVSVTLDGKANDASGEFTDDVLTENVDGADSVVGDSGPNKLTNIRFMASGGADNDTLTGTGGTLLDGGEGADTMSNGFVDYFGRTVGVNVSMDGVANDGAPGEQDNVTNIRQLYGTAFNDTLTGSAAGDTLVGLGGDDSLVGLGGDDLLIGGDEQNVLFNYADFDLQSLIDAANGDFQTVDGNDTLLGGDGNDGADYAGRTNALTLSLDGVANDGAAGESDNIGTDVEVVYGGYSDDHFIGNAADNTFIGGPGADDYVGGAGFDQVSYNDGGYYPVNGFYYTVHKAVNVSINDQSDDGEAGEGDDVHSDIEGVTGTYGADTLTAGNGPATLDGFSGAGDLLTGGDSADRLISNGFALLRGGGGDDVFVNQNGLPDTIDGGDGFDSVQDDDVDYVATGIQNDTFIDTEFVYDKLNQDSQGNPVPDVAVAAARTPAAAVVSGASIDAKNILRVNGTDAADTITLAQSGRKVTVTINGVSYGTYLTTDFKAISVEANGGNDTVNLATLTFGARVQGGDGNDTLLGGAGGDQLAGQGGSDSVDGAAGNDIVSGDYIVLQGDPIPAGALKPDGSDTVNGGSGDTDILSYTDRLTAANINMISGTVVSKGETDHISGIELMVGTQANDIVAGGKGNDVLFSGPGDDSLSGGPGIDQLSAGFGSDTINPDGGGDIIDTGPDQVEDQIIARLLGTTAYNSAGNILFPGKNGFNKQDYFTLSKTFYNA